MLQAVENTHAAGKATLPELSPMKAPRTAAFIPLSPGPEKAKLHMEVVSSLLGLSSVENKQKKPVSLFKEPVVTEVIGQWTLTRPVAPTSTTPLRATIRLTPCETYSRSLVLPRAAFEKLFGPQMAKPAARTVLVEPSSSGTLLALPAELSADGAGFSLRAGPLLNALRASPGDFLVLSIAPVEDGNPSGTPLRALACLETHADAKEAGSAAGSPTNLNALTTPALIADGSGNLDTTDTDPLRAPATASNVDGYDDLMSDGADGRASPSEAAALAAVGQMIEEEMEEDPEWNVGKGANAGPKTRGRPRKRKPFSSAGGVGTGAGTTAAAAAGGRTGAALAGCGLQCMHCGTHETPRWWKDSFPMGTLCNACGIWLKRHGYPRPVQFFASPAAAAAAVPAAARGPTVPAAAAAAAGTPGPQPGEFYLINGRPKRRRAASTAGAGAAYEVPMPAPDAAINFDAAGGRVFVVRRKLLPDASGDSIGSAMIHFGWAPNARAAHEMYDKVVAYSNPECELAVEDFELLADTKATATLVLKSNTQAPGDWDAIVRHFVGAL